jgi:hypothetical protein
MTVDLAPVIFYPAELPTLVILRNSTFRKRFIVKVDGTELDLTQNNLIIDADIKDATGTLIGTFTAVLPEDENQDEIPGMFDLELTPAEALALPLGTTHQTDISITNPDGDRFYYAKAPVEVRDTVSRND